MPRIAPIQEADHPELAPAIRRIRDQRGGKLLTLYSMLLHSAPVAEGWLALLTAIRQQCDLSPGIRELVILRIAALNRADYEFAAHVSFALEAGIDQTVIDALRRGETPPSLGRLEKAALDYADQMTRSVDVDDEVFAVVAQLLSEREMIELTATVAAYNMVSRFLVALGIRPVGDKV
jgi:alkylhydroperoxidase family enzyme